MNEVWKNIFKDWVECYHSIEIIEKHSITDGDVLEDLKKSLLEDIICTCKGELEE